MKQLTRRTGCIERNSEGSDTCFNNKTQKKTKQYEMLAKHELQLKNMNDTETKELIVQQANKILKLLEINE